MKQAPRRFLVAVGKTTARLIVSRDALRFRCLLMLWGPTVLRKDVKVLFVERERGAFGEIEVVRARFHPRPDDAPKTRTGRRFSTYDPTGRLMPLFHLRARASQMRCHRLVGPSTWRLG